MLPLRKNYTVSSNDITNLIKTHYTNLMHAFYESQSSFLCGIYKRYKSIETANIVLSFARNVHLSIIRQVMVMKVTILLTIVVIHQMF